MYIMTLLCEKSNSSVWKYLEIDKTTMYTGALS